MPYFLIFIAMFNLVCATFASAKLTDLELLDLTEQTLAKLEPEETTKITRLLRDINIEIDDRRAIMTVTNLWYYPSQTAVQDYGYDSIYYNGHSEVLSKLKALTIDAEGKVFWFDPEDARTIESDSYNVFSNGKEVIVNYVGLSSGSISALHYTIETDLTQLESYWSELFYLQSYSAQQLVNITVNNNNNQAIYFKASDPLINCLQQASITQCTAKDIPPLERGDSFYYRDVAMHVAFSQVDQWQPIVEVMLDAYSVARSNNASVLQQMPKVIKPEMSTEEKISAIHQYVARDIRYLSESEGGNAYTPHSVSRTVDKKYGDCKDKTVLLLEMFEQIGVPAYPVLVSTVRRDPHRLLLPSASYFNHVVMCFEYLNQTYCIDATDTTTDWRTTSEWIQGHASLPLTAKPLAQTMLQDPHTWSIDNIIDIQITPEGGQTERQQITFKQAYASSYRSSLESMDSDEQVEYLVELYQDIVSEGALPQASVSGVNDLADDIIIFTENQFEPYLEMQELISVIDYEPWINSELNSYTPDNKIYGTYFDGSRVRSTISVTLPDGWHMQSYPASLALPMQYGELVRKVSMNKQNGFTLTTTFELPAVHLPAEQIEVFNGMIDLFKQQSFVRFTAVEAK